jgi:hypothetical protein
MQEEYTFDTLGLRPVYDRVDYERSKKVKEVLSIFFQTFNIVSNQTLTSDCLDSVNRYRLQHPRSTVASVATAAALSALRTRGEVLDVKTACDRLGLSRRLVGRILLEISRPPSLVSRALNIFSSLIPKLHVQTSDQQKITDSIKILVENKILSPSSLHAGVLAVIIFWTREHERKLSVCSVAAAADIPASSTYGALRAVEKFFK